MRDFLPQEMGKFRNIEEVFRRACSSWGYQEIRTPVLEYLHLFTATGTLTPDMLSRVYSFLDWNGWSGERVVLRPDGTIPTARLFVTELGQQRPARLFYVQDVFSFQAEEKESRERWQCGGEFIGGLPPLAEAELILLAGEVLGQLGIKAEVRLGHIGLVKALVQGLGGGEEAVNQVLEGDLGTLDWSRAPHWEPVVRLLFEQKGSSPGFLHNFRALLPTLPPAQPAWEDFLSLTELLASLGVEFVVDLASGRGFEYYTGAVFQFFAEGERLGGGGRYDDLIPLLGGGNSPAAGFALYMDRIMNRLPQPPLRTPIQVRAPSPKDWGRAFSLAQKLRQEGYVVEWGTGSAQATAVLVEGEGIRLTDRRGRERTLSSVSELLLALRDDQASPA